MIIDEKIRQKLVLAMDVETLDEAKTLVDILGKYIGTFKVGLQLYTKYGNEIIDYIIERDANFFLDVKLHDIPNTVMKASENMVYRGAKFFNVHASGGYDMMKAAVEGAKEGCKKNYREMPIILAVTVLTSISNKVLQEEFDMPNMDTSKFALRLAMLAKMAGMNGVVASVHEVEAIKAACGKDFIVLCPGIRPSWSAKNDQERIASPKAAIEKGADYLVLGRAVTEAPSLVDAIQKIYKEIGEIL